MTGEEIISNLLYMKRSVKEDTIEDRTIDEAIEIIKAQPCEDAISKQAVKDAIKKQFNHIKLINKNRLSKKEQAIFLDMNGYIDALPPVTPKQRLCKDCKFFETDSWAKVGEIPLIVAHEICNRWGDGCKTSEDGYCFLFEPKKGESK